MQEKVGHSKLIKKGMKRCGHIDKAVIQIQAFVGETTIDGGGRREVYSNFRGVSIWKERDEEKR